MNFTHSNLSRVLRHAGDAIGLLIAAGFLFAALVCWGNYGRHIAVAGRPSFTFEAVQTVVRDGTIAFHAGQWLASWAWLVATGGCLVVAVAGLRWALARAAVLLSESHR